MTIPGPPGLRMILSRPGTVQQLCSTSRASCSFPKALKCWLTIRSVNTETTWWMLTYAPRRRPLRRSSTMHSSPIVGVPSASVVYPGWTIPVSQDATGPAMVQRQGLSVYMTLTRASRAYTSSQCVKMVDALLSGQPLLFVQSVSSASWTESSCCQICTRVLTKWNARDC